jgi:hypothetical protein
MPNPTATIFLPYHALDDVILRGTRAAQPAAAAVTPGTLYGLTDEGNAVERSTGTVWQPYSPTAGGGAPPAHHATHETGGTDAIAALSGAVLTSGTVPDARLSANVPRLSASNVFTGAIQELGVALRVRNATPPANARLWQAYTANSGSFGVSAFDDAGATEAFALILSRLGSLTVYGDVTEKNRLTPMGHWIAVPFNAANFAGSGSMTWTIASGGVTSNRYTLIGKTLMWNLLVQGTLAGTASNAVTLTLPGGFTPVQAVQAVGQINPNSAGWVPALVSVPGGTVVTVYRLDAAPLALGTCYLACQLIMETT